MLQKRVFSDALIVISSIMIGGCAATGGYKDDFSRFRRISSKECISFGHVTGSEGYNQCMEKKLRAVLPEVMKSANEGDNDAKSRALRICLNLAKQGDVTAMYNVGYMCLEGWGGKQDTDICMRWLKTAAGSGHARSAKVLSGIYSEGKFGISSDEVKTETRLDKLPQFEPEIVYIPPPDGDPHAEEIICRGRVFTGSRFEYRRCATKGEWAKIDRKNRKQTEAFIREIEKGNRRNQELPGEDMVGHMPR